MRSSRRVVGILGVAVVLLVISTPVVTGHYHDPEPNEVTVVDNPGVRDQIVVELRPETDNPTDVAERGVREAGFPVRSVAIEESVVFRNQNGERTSDYRVVVETTVSRRTGPLTGRIDGEALAALAEIPSTEEVDLRLDLPGPVVSDDLDSRDQSDRSPDVSVAPGQTIDYRLPVAALAGVVGLCLASVVVPFAVLRLFGRRVTTTNAPVDERVHRLRTARGLVLGVSLGSLALVAFLGGVPAVVLLLVEALSTGVTGTELGRTAVFLGSLSLPLVGALVGSFVGTLPANRELRDVRVDTSSAVKHTAARLLITVAPVAGWLVFLSLLPPGVFASDLVLVGLFAAFLCSLSVLQPLLILLLLDVRRLEAEPRDRLDALCARVSVTPREIYRLDDGGRRVANAAATGVIPGLARVLVTDRLVEEFPADELEAIVAHELGHIRERHLLYRGLAATVAVGALVFLFDSLGLFALFGLFVFYVVAIRGELGVRQEYQADAYAARATDAATTARALRRLGETNVQRRRTDWLQQRLSRHPSYDDRIEALGIDPETVTVDAGPDERATED